MRKFYILVAFIILSATLFGQGVWQQKASLSENGRYATYFFSALNKGYIGGGETAPGIYKNDLWEFDPAVGTWTQKADFGGGSCGNMYAPAVFVIDNIAYVCTGYDINNQFKNTVWAYNPMLNMWAQKNNFPGTARYGAFAFSIGTKGYLGMGQNLGSINDFWEYTPSTDTWVSLTNFSSNARYGAIGFSINGKGYAGFGSSQGNNTNYNDFYEFDPVSQTWTPKAYFPGSPRYYPTYFVINGIAYVGTGNPTTNYNPSPTYSNDLYAYNPLTNSWTTISAFSESRRSYAASFTINNKGYIGMGLSGAPNNNYLSDFWEYTPTSSSINDNTSNPLAFIKMNMTNKTILLTVEQQSLPAHFRIFDLSGRTVISTVVNDTEQHINISRLAKATYIYSLSVKEKHILTDKFIIY